LKSKHIIYKEKKTRSSVSPSTRSYSKEPKDKEELYYYPTEDCIRIIDFGGATYINERHSDIINTRQYRAPEVILGILLIYIQVVVNGMKNQIYGRLLAY
jgi:hypothetical protein